MSNTPGKVRNAEEQALPEKSDKVFSDNISAKSQKQRLDAFKALGMDLKKAFLGQDTLKKLAVIYEVQYGEPLNTNDMSYEVLGDLLSFCVNKCYNSKSMETERKKNIPKVSAATTPAGQLLYRYHQMATSVDGEELDVTTDKFNVENKRGHKYFPHISTMSVEFSQFPLWAEKSEYSDAEHDNQEWLPRDIQILRDRGKVRQQIIEWNEQAKTAREADIIGK